MKAKKTQDKCPGLDSGGPLMATVNATRTFEGGRFRKRKTKRRGGILLRYFEDRLTGHLYAIQERIVA
jgi:hypothetical protein